MRVALNLVFLVPGETGGMEVYARELIPRLAERVELVALVNREAAGPSHGTTWRSASCRSTRATACNGCAASRSTCRG